MQSVHTDGDSLTAGIKAVVLDCGSGAALAYDWTGLSLRSMAKNHLERNITHYHVKDRIPVNQGSIVSLVEDGIPQKKTSKP